MKQHMLLIAFFLSVQNVFAGNLFDTERINNAFKLIPILESYPYLVRLHIADQVSKKLTDTDLIELGMRNKTVYKLSGQESNMKTKHKTIHLGHYKIFLRTKNSSHK